jgi:hypothetical protein
MASMLDLPTIGKLEIVEVYEFFDEPVLFACRDLLDSLYLAVWVEVTEEGRTWLFARMSPRRFEHVRSGMISLHDAFAKAELGWVYEVRIPDDEHESARPSVTQVRAADLTEDVLPRVTSFLQLQTQTLPDLAPTFAQAARQAQREYVRLRISYPSVKRNEAPAHSLGRLLFSFQELLDSISASLAGHASERGPIAERIRERTQAMVLGLQPGSVQVELASARQSDMLQQSHFRDAARELVSLIKQGSDEAKLGESINRFGVRVGKRYLAFLGALENDVADARITWVSPAEEDGDDIRLAAHTVHKTAEALRRYETVESNVFDFVGILVGADSATADFHVKCGMNDYRGKVDAGAMGLIRGVTLDQSYEVTLRARTTTGLTLEHSTTRYELVRLGPVPPEPTSAQGQLF